MKETLESKERSGKEKDDGGGTRKKQQTDEVYIQLEPGWQAVRRVFVVQEIFQNKQKRRKSLDV